MLFDPFLRALKAELGYSVDIGKLKQLIEWSSAENARKGSLTLERIKPVLRVLYLQNQKDHAAFESLLNIHFSAIDKWCSEVEKEMSVEVKQEIQTTTPSAPIGQSSGKETSNEPTDTGKQRPSDSSGPKLGPKEKPKSDDEDQTVPADMKEPPDELQEQGWFLNFELGTDESEGISKAESGFLLNDSFLPMSHREMVHSWRHLRVKDGWKLSNNLDIPASVEQIARNRIPDNLIFHKEPVNTGKDLLLILVDRGGSMLPFHYLTDQIIKAACGDGGHKKAKIYYFYNVPSRYLFKEPSLTKPEALSNILHGLNPRRSRVLIISDGGALRGNRNKMRLEKTIDFLNGPMKETGLEGLLKTSKSVVWLNPMPLHRWYGTTVIDILRRSDIHMFPVLDMGGKSLLEAVSVLMGKIL